MDEMKTVRNAPDTAYKRIMEGAADGVKTAISDIRLGCVDLTTFPETVDQLDYIDEYGLGYELGYMRTLLKEKYGQPVGSKFNEILLMRGMTDADQIRKRI